MWFHHISWALTLTWTVTVAWRGGSRWQVAVVRCGGWLFAVLGLVAARVVDALNVATLVVGFAHATIPSALVAGWAQWIAGAFRSAVTISDVLLALAGACWGWWSSPAWWTLRYVALRITFAVPVVSLAL